MKWGPGEMPNSHLPDWDKVLVSWYGAAALGASVVPLSRKGHYMSALTCVDTSHSFGVSATQCRAINAVMKTSGGVELTNAAYGGVLGDIGNSDYQALWCSNVDARLNSQGLGGVFIDDFSRNYLSVSGGVVAALYPGNDSGPIPAYDAALVEFASYVYNYFHSRGKFVILNSWGYIGNDPLRTQPISQTSYWDLIGPYSDGLMQEYWLTSGWPPDEAALLTGAAWLNWLAAPRWCETHGKEFSCVWGGTTALGAQYVLLSMFLEHKGVIYPGTLWPNEWIPVFDQTVLLGDPTGAKYQNGNRWQRQFEGGLVWVDPVAKTSGIS